MKLQLNLEGEKGLRRTTLVLMLWLVLGVWETISYIRRWRYAAG